MFKNARASFKHYLDTRYPDWDITIALRYLPIVDDLKRRKRGETILEVGSEIQGITPYLRAKVTGLDQGFDYSRRNKWLTPVEGSADALPFPDRSFTYLLSVDMLEHLPGKIRPQTIKEMLRVADKRIYLSFPCGKHSESVDQELDSYFFDRNGYHFPYLEEHVKNGLPPCDLVTKLVQADPDWELEIRGNTNSYLWKFLLKLGLSNTQWKTSLYRRLLFLLPILKYYNFSPTYRQLYIITRKS